MCLTYAVLLSMGMDLEIPSSLQQEIEDEDRDEDTEMEMANRQLRPREDLAEELDAARERRWGRCGVM